MKIWEKRLRDERKRIREIDREGEDYMGEINDSKRSDLKTDSLTRTLL